MRSAALSRSSAIDWRAIATIFRLRRAQGRFSPGVAIGFKIQNKHNASVL
jgi:hypothetical protein